MDPRPGFFSPSAAEVARRLAFVGFTAADAALLRRYAPALGERAGEVAEALYAHIQTLPALGAILDGHLTQCKLKQTSYLQELLAVRIDATYAASRAWVGEVHRVMGVEPHWYVAAYCHLQQLLLERLSDLLHDDPRELARVTRALTKLVSFDMALALEAYVSAEAENQTSRQRALDELSSPAVLDVGQGVVVIPLVGRLEERHGERLRAVVLGTFVDAERRGLVLHLAQLPGMDRDTARVMSTLSGDLEALGLKLVLSGLGPDLRGEAKRLGVELEHVRYAPTLPAAIRLARA